MRVNPETPETNIPQVAAGPDTGGSGPTITEGEINPETPNTNLPQVAGGPDTGGFWSDEH